MVFHFKNNFCDTGKKVCYLPKNAHFQATKKKIRKSKIKNVNKIEFTIEKYIGFN